LARERARLAWNREPLREMQQDAIVANHPGCNVQDEAYFSYQLRIARSMSAAQKIGKTESTGEVEDVCR
jgi:hypothetical protein